MSTLARNIPLSETTGTAQSTSRARSITSSRGNTLAIYLEHLLRRSSRSTLIWAISVAAYGAMIVAAFPSLSGAVDINAYPRAVREAMNITSMSQIAPFLSTEILSYLPLVLAFLPMMVFAGAIAGAEERGSLDVLLGTPLPRRHLVIANFIATAVNLLVVSAFLGLVLWLTSLSVDAGLSLAKAMAGSLAVAPIALALGSVALLFSSLFRQRSRALGLAVGVMFAMYMLDLLSKLVDGFSWMRYLSAFHYDGNAIVDGISGGGTIILLATSLLLAGLAIAMFERRDVFA
ncbi:MAG: ABC transporter permease subunit [Thermomicrobiales bacterium]